MDRIEAERREAVRILGRWKNNDHYTVDDVIADFRAALEAQAAAEPTPFVADVASAIERKFVSEAIAGAREVSADKDLTRNAEGGSFWAGYELGIDEVERRLADLQAALPPLAEAQAAAPRAEPYGQVTTHSQTGQQFFYRWPEPPYLDNASECIMVYTHPPAAAPLQPAVQPDIQGEHHDK